MFPLVRTEVVRWAKKAREEQHCSSALWGTPGKAFGSVCVMLTNISTAVCVRKPRAFSAPAEK